MISDGEILYHMQYESEDTDTYGGYFEAFMHSLKTKEQEKIQYGLLLLKSQKTSIYKICQAYY